MARSAHPDVGGSLAAMQAINAAADEALRRHRSVTGSSPPPSAADPLRSPPPAGRLSIDHPSFTVEALPVDTFEALVVVASWLGEIVDDDPPYALEVLFDAPLTGWCRLDLVPDAGASTVSIAVAAVDGHPAPDVEAVRDRWIDALNRLDWG